MLSELVPKNEVHHLDVDLYPVRSDFGLEFMGFIEGDSWQRRAGTDMFSYAWFMGKLH